MKLKTLNYPTIYNPTAEIPLNTNNTSDGVEQHADDQAGSIVA